MSEIDDDDIEALREAAAVRGMGSVEATTIDPSTWTGVGLATRMGFMRGGAIAGQGVALAASVPLIIQDKAESIITGKPTTGRAEAAFATMDALVRPAVAHWKPEVGEVGSAGNILGSLAEMVVPLAAGGGNPALLMQGQATQSSLSLLDQGVDVDTAIDVGVTDAIVTGIGFKLPFLGKTLTSRGLTGVGGNLGLGIGGAALNRETLESGGYDKIAEQYDPFDPTARTIDTLAGLGFGTIAHFASRGAVPVGAVDAALTARNAAHLSDSAHPGTPSDPAAATASVDAMTAAAEQIQAGQRVDVAALVADIPFAPRPAGSPELMPARGVVEDALAEIEHSPVARQRDGSLANFDRARDVLESGGSDKAFNAASGAAGRYQFVEKTFRNLVKMHRPAWAEGMTDAQVMQQRFNPERAKEMIGHLDRENASALTRAGVPVNNATMYAAHHFGAKRAIGFAKASDDTPVDQLFSKAAMADNPYLRHKKGTPKAGQPLTKRELVANWRARTRKVGAFDDQDLDEPGFGVAEAPVTLAPDSPIVMAIPKNDVGDLDTSLIRTPERDVLRQRIEDQHFAKLEPIAPREAGERPVVYLMGGGGASGKGTILNLLKEQGVVPRGILEVDPDAIKTGAPKRGIDGLPEYDDFVAAGDGRGAAVTHNESSNLAKRIADRAISERRDFVYDRTMGDPVKGLADIAKLKAAGYEVRIFGVTVDPKIALVRAGERATKRFRFVPPKNLLAAHRGFAEGWEAYAREADQAKLYDNSGELSDLALLAEKQGADLSIRNESGYAAFGKRRAIDDQATTLRGVDSPPNPGRERGSLAEFQADSGAGRAGDEGAGRRGSGESRSGDAAREGSAAEAVNPAMRELDELAAEAGDVEFVAGYDADGAPIYRSIAAERAEIEADRQRDIREADAYEAAVNCYLKRGPANAA